MHPNPKPYKPGQWILLGTIFGAFIGLLLGKFALGLIFGFFVGIAVDSSKRKAASAPTEQAASDKNNHAG